MTAPPLRCRGLTRYYGPVVGVEALDLTLERGEVFGLVGLNGAGKSTTLKLLVGALSPSAGSVELFGAPARSAVAERRQLGFLPSEAALYREQTARDNLDLFAKLSGIDPRSLAARRHELGARLGLNELDLGRPVGEMSHGMRQKIGILQAIEHEPALVVLDEPSDGLDPVAREVLAELVTEIRARGGSVLLASHVLTEIEAVADRVGVLHRGKLVALETRASLRRREALFVDVSFDPDATEAETESAPSADTLAAIDGVTVVERTSHRVTLRVHPPVDRIVKLLAEHTVTTLEARSPRLEDLVREIVAS